MRGSTSDAYAMDTRSSERKVRTGPFMTTVQGGWVGQTQSQTSSVASYRSVPVTSYEDVEHYRDEYTTYGEDPSLPDMYRSHETTTVHTGRQSWTEQREHTRYESEFDGYRDVTTMWRDISWDGGGRTRSEWRVPSAGHRVYHVGITLFGRMLHSRLYDAAHMQWNRPAALGWRLLERQALALIATDVAAWRGRARGLKPGGFGMTIGDLVCFDATVASVASGTATVNHGKGSRDIAAKPGLSMSTDDLLLLAGPPHSRAVSIIHNVTTGESWRILDGSTRPSARTVLRENALTVAAGLVGLAALGVGLYDDTLQHLTAPVFLAAIATGYLLGRRASHRLAILKMRLETARAGIDDVESYFRTLGWRGIRNLPPTRTKPSGHGERR